MNRLAEFTAGRTGSKPLVFDFEREFLYQKKQGGRDWFHFLDERQDRQREHWRFVWDKAYKQFADPDQDVYLGLHGCITRAHFGVRSILDAAAVAEEFRPDVVITLIDNVYDQWWRTTHKCKDRDFMGKPTLEQLLTARRAELVMADALSGCGGLDVPNYVLAVNHPTFCLYNLAHSPDPHIVYLSFPISQPRKLLNPKDKAKSPDPSGIAEVTSFVGSAFQMAEAQKDVVVVCPLAIDEIPLLVAAQNPKNHVEVAPEDPEDPPCAALEFDRDSYIWDLSSVLPADASVSAGPPDSRAPIPLDELDDADALIRTDVGWRDFRLVDQSSALAVFNPTFKESEDGIASGVKREIAEACRLTIPSYIYQDDGHDLSGATKAAYFDKSSMGKGPTHSLVKRAATSDEALQLAMERPLS